MLFQLQEIQRDGAHGWALVQSACDLDAPEDALVTELATMVREAYGEHDIIQMAEPLKEPDPAVADTFDLALVRGFRKGLPDPAAEANKPPQLSNYRSETAELLARGALAAAHAIEFPTAPQRGKTNANQPILGFDGWGMLKMTEQRWALVLVQVKGTDDPLRPPKEAHKLAEECRRAHTKLDAVARALTVMAVQTKDLPINRVIVQMLATVGEGIMPQLVVAPVVVRGEVAAQQADLNPVRTVIQGLPTVIGRGMVMSIGVDLTRFGQVVMHHARGAA